jgi:hypothetical protein
MKVRAIDGNNFSKYYNTISRDEMESFFLTIQLNDVNEI